MNHSYLYTKRFIDEQVKILNQPLRLTDSLKQILQQQDENADKVITEAQLKKVLVKLNTKIRNRNQVIFRAQIVNQIVQQVLKLEQNNLEIVNEQLTKIHYVLKPILIPDFEHLSNKTQLSKLMELGDLIKELPESQYILVRNTAEEEPDSEEESDEASDENILIQDDQDIVEKKPSQRKQIAQHRREVIQKVQQAENRDENLVERYHDLRANLLKLYESIRYKYDRSNYLKGLKNNIQGSLGISKLKADTHGNDQVYDSDEEGEGDYDINGIQTNLITTSANTNPDNVIAEVNKFRVLTEKLSYKVTTTGITGPELRQVVMDINSSS
ncbi:uncharacterized protein SPAPADRAFT_62211 [Spathaspora passalidarum NRRL Y-27907]|uniref:Uncharacterized protein n=1 Tax=Spathaspora passalidarum (strain NRRL Y-27907 / 11-Y1) TaxID=619300 RepID=G3AQQ1_SPAPN|nr:uncharacterized protein SPAPADRAFT_62211 [Spathaspora passalidarum NRRL Y-27907]EGW31598.1 hypothetical protein SPAPADRAFT_62211 [Spathaspora passalidarum NRRL Y-27907]